MPINRNKLSEKKSAKKPYTKIPQKIKKENKNRRELWGFVCVVFAFFSLICWFDTEAFLIRFTAKLVGGLFGQMGRLFLPVILVRCAIILFRNGDRPVRVRIIATFTILLTLSGCAHLISEFVFGNEVSAHPGKLFTDGQTWVSGGVFPGLITELLEFCLTKIGAFIIWVLVLIAQIMTSLGITLDSLITAIKNRPRMPDEPEKPKEDPATRIVNRVAMHRIEKKERRRAADYDIPVDDPMEVEPEEKKPSRKKSAEKPKADIQDKPISSKHQMTIDEIELQDPEKSDDTPVAAEEITEQPPVTSEPPIPTQAPETVDKIKKGEAEANASEISEQIEKNTAVTQPIYQYPSVSLLNIGAKNRTDATPELRLNTKRLADALKSFGVEPHIVDVIRGPSVTRYELELDPGVKLSKITNLADDIALSLGASGVRISAIPDKISVVGIEVPNKAVNTVYVREVIDSRNFITSKSKLAFAVGKDISGNCIIGDIGKMPHLLIAGTTGSGKSVCTNTLITSLLYKASPEDVRLIMIDPKMVELGVYNEIPHLLIPVVTDPKKAAGSLQWAVSEMMRRYKAMSDAGVRDLESYNSIAEHEDGGKLPQVVVIIDELADLMLVAAKEVEESICRIAQMGRAAGIHLVIATQRPSADVITGLMKANIPSRIAFAVASAMESRIILDTQGAEKLVGKGDMLYAPIGNGKPKRVQGCYVSDSEVEAVASYVKNHYSSTYDQNVMEEIERKAAQTGNNKAAAVSAEPEPSSEEMDGDEMLPAAVEVILETGQASVSMLQRRLKLGYARAARIVDEMEEKGIVGPFQGSKPRAILVTKEQWAAMRSPGDVQMDFDDLADEFSDDEDI